MELEGRASEIKEYSLAVDVFDRHNYDPKVESLVRVEAGRLRKLLSQYHQEEGRDEPIHIEIPKGSYIPRISAVASGGHSRRGTRLTGRWRVGIGVAILGIAGLSVWVWQ